MKSQNVFCIKNSYIFSIAEKAEFKVLQLRTTARSPRWMYAASYLIHRNGSLPGGSPQKLGLGLWLTVLAFQLIEHSLGVFGDVGEEIVVIATK